MDNKKLISKIAADKDSKALGKIIRIEQLLGKTIKIKKPHALIFVRRFLRNDVLVPILVEKITKIEGQYVWFDITKEAFTELLKQAAAIKTEREIYSGEIIQQSSSNSFSTGIDPSGLSKGRKERKR
ncbi:MAG: hypothetical protein ACTSSK_02700 [Candidatus Heimdallarchaeota archaeon]